MEHVAYAAPKAFDPIDDHLVRFDCRIDSSKLQRGHDVPKGTGWKGPTKRELSTSDGLVLTVNGYSAGHDKPPNGLVAFNSARSHPWSSSVYLSSRSSLRTLARHD
jgi:hypothetical protein